MVVTAFKYLSRRIIFVFQDRLIFDKPHLGSGKISLSLDHPYSCRDAVSKLILCRLFSIENNKDKYAGEMRNSHDFCYGGGLFYL